MIMMGMKFMHEVPFHVLYIHALVRDAERQKMSKTKGNVIDPLEITEKYGTDAVRFALAISAAPGTDIVVSPDKFDSYRAFANKIWNAARFVLMNYRKLHEKVQRQIADALKPMPGLGFDAVATPEHLALADRWVFSRLLTTAREIDEALGQFRFHEAADKIYHFFWHEFCDWYLEWVKPEITRPVEETGTHASWINLARVFEAALHLLHPFMPFITEELWHELTGRRRDESISLAPFNMVSERVADPISEKQFETIQELIVASRNAKAELNLQKQKPSAQVACDDLRILELFRAHQDSIHRLAGLQATNFVRGRVTGETADVRHSATFDLRILHEEKIDSAAERSRLEREKAKLEQSLSQSQGQLNNQGFMSRAPQDVVRGVQRRHAELTEHLRKVSESLRKLPEA